MKGARVCALANGQASSAQKESNAVESSKGTKQRPRQQPGVNKQGVGVKAAKKKETKAKEETRNKKRGRSSKGENEGGVRTGMENDSETVEGFSRSVASLAAPISDRYRYSTLVEGKIDV